MIDIQAMINRWQEGDERAAELLYQHFCAPTFRLAYGLLGNAQDAEEAAQDALNYALSHIAHYDPARASFRTWLHTITVSRCRDRQRRIRPPLVALAEWLGLGYDIPSPGPGPERQAVLKENHDAVWDAVQTLRPLLREAILLRYWADHTFGEMAEILDCPVQTAQSRVRLAYQHLRRALSGAGLPAFEEEER
ncbi:MAG: sigma-70 family RNA polymerase sigma factor [Anaerolineae bacterium]|nr:sigma-70 family RNA polymerase sigma factor [Anaerolineae bacterium]